VPVDPGEYIGREHRGSDHLDPILRRIKQLLHHLEGHGIRLVSSGTPHDPDPGVGVRVASYGQVSGVPFGGGRRILGEPIEVPLVACTTNWVSSSFNRPPSRSCPA
jgi:hypothetical protein